MILLFYIIFYLQKFAAPGSSFSLSFNQAFNHLIPPLQEAATTLMENWEPTNEKPREIQIGIF